MKIKYLLAFIIFIINSFCLLAQTQHNVKCMRCIYSKDNIKNNPDKLKGSGLDECACDACYQKKKKEDEARKAEIKRIDDAIALKKKLEFEAQKKAQQEKLEKELLKEKERKENSTITITNTEFSKLASKQNDFSIAVLNPSAKNDTINAVWKNGYYYIKTNSNDTVARISYNPLIVDQFNRHLPLNKSTAYYYIPVFFDKNKSTKSLFKYKISYNKVYFINARGEVMFPDLNVYGYAYIGDGFYMLWCDIPENNVKVYDKVRNKLLEVPDIKFSNRLFSSRTYLFLDVLCGDLGDKLWSGINFNTDVEKKKFIAQWPGLAEKMNKFDANIFFGLKDYAHEGASDDVENIPYTFFVITKNGSLINIGSIQGYNKYP